MIRFVLNCIFAQALTDAVLITVAEVDPYSNGDKDLLRNDNDEPQARYYRKRQSQPATSNRCFSCMNSEFDDYWSEMQLLYVKPVNFTDACLSLPARINIGFVMCDGACIVIKEQRLAGGTSHSYNVVRGCINSVSRAKLSPSVINFSRRSFSSRNICQVLEAKDLFVDLRNARKRTKDDDVNSAPIFPVTVCTCYGHLCNSDAIAASEKPKKAAYEPLLFICLLLLKHRLCS